MKTDKDDISAVTHPLNPAPPPSPARPPVQPIHQPSPPFAPSTRPNPLPTNRKQRQNSRKHRLSPLIAHQRAVPARQLILMPALDILPGLVPHRLRHFHRHGAGVDVHSDAGRSRRERRAGSERAREEGERVPFGQVLLVGAVQEDAGGVRVGGEEGCGVEGGGWPGGGGGGWEGGPLVVVLGEEEGWVGGWLVGGWRGGGAFGIGGCRGAMVGLRRWWLGGIAVGRTGSIIAWIHGLGVVVAVWMLVLLVFPILPIMTQAALAIEERLLFST